MFFTIKGELGDIFKHCVVLSRHSQFSFLSS